MNAGSIQAQKEILFNAVFLYMFILITQFLKKIYEHLIPYNFLKFYCLKSKRSGNVMVMFRQCWAMYWQCSAMFVIIQSERSDYENKRTLFRYPDRRHKV